MKKIVLFLIASGLLTQGYALYENSCMPEYWNNFDGAYVGGTVGWAFHDRTWIDRDRWAIEGDVTDFIIANSSAINNGIEFGMQVGYNFQCGRTLLGLEIDANWADTQRTKLLRSGGTLLETNLELKDDIKWFGSLRARVGVISNTIILFGTAGAAWADVKQNWTLINTPLAFTETFGVHNVRWGLVLGAGVEWEFCSSFGFKADVLYHKFPKFSTSFFSTRGREFNFDLLNDIWVARIGVNYRLRSLFSCFC